MLLGGLFGINFNIFSFLCLLLKTRYLQQQTSTEELPFEANSTDGTAGIRHFSDSLDPDQETSLYERKVREGLWEAREVS